MITGLTISRYLAVTYLINTGAVLLGLLTLIYLFDTIELIRRATSDAVPLPLILQMGLLKLPEVGQVLFPFAILFSAIFTFWQFNRRSELVILRASGFSAWQFLMPLAWLAMLIGLLQIGVINPLGSVLIGKYERLENQYLNKQENEIALFKGGLWLRQGVHYKTGNALPAASPEKGYVILHARKIEQENWSLNTVSAFYFDQNDNFIMRLDAPSARLEQRRWIFSDARILSAAGQTLGPARYTLPTHLTVRDIEESFSSPESMSFWNLPSHIQTLEETGFNASRLRVHYHSLLSQPLFLAAMILLAATVSMRSVRAGGTLIMVAGGIFMGFVIFFFSSYLQALGYSGQLPPAMAAWSPSIILTLLGLTILINLEDG